MVNGFITENFPKGYVMSVDWESYSEFDRYPAFGKPCKTYKVTFVNGTITENETIWQRKDS